MRIVLVTPEIPQNTGSIARTCAALKFPLHIIEPMSFEISDKTVRRAGLDYWPYVELKTHKSWDDFLQTEKTGNIFAFTKFAERAYYEAKFNEDDTLVFGSETKGLGQEFLSQFNAEFRLSIPMPCKEVRSLNLSNAVSIAAYEAARQFWIS